MDANATLSVPAFPRTARVGSRSTTTSLHRASVDMSPRSAASHARPPQRLRGGSRQPHLSAARDNFHSRLKVKRDVRTYLPPWASRFLGWRPAGAKAPFDPLPFLPFSWLKHIPLQWEVWLLSLIGAFVGIALIEIVMGTAFVGSPHGVGVVLIIGSFGASAVLTYGAVDSPLAQPRHLVGGQVISAMVGVIIARLFRLAHAYELSDVTVHGELGHVVWLSGALGMALALLAMQITKTVHPPGGATALIASVQPAAVHMSWRYIYIVLISSLLMLGWGMIINNVGRRRYPTYWISGERVYVHDTKVERTTTRDDVMMAAEEGRNEGFDKMVRVMSSDTQTASGLSRPETNSVIPNETRSERVRAAGLANAATMKAV